MFTCTDQTATEVAHMEEAGGCSGESHSFDGVVWVKYRLNSLVAVFPWVDLSGTGACDIFCKELLSSDL